MRLATHTIWIARSPEEVFDYFTDMSKASEWRMYVQTMERIDEGPLRAGSRFRVEMTMMGEPHEFELEVLTVERPRLWRHRTNEEDFRGHIEYRFEPSNAGTQVTMTIEVKPVGLYGWLAVPLLKLRREKPYAAQLPQLKRAMEGHAHATA